jgi:hypothetical protein
VAAAFPSRPAVAASSLGGRADAGFGTLYTAVYRPADLAIEYRWRDSSWPHSIGSLTSGQHQAVLG